MGKRGPQRPYVEKYQLQRVCMCDTWLEREFDVGYRYKWTYLFFSYIYRYFQGVMFASPSIVNKIEIWSDLEAASSANNLIFARGDVWANLPRRYSIVQKHTQLNNMI